MSSDPLQRTSNSLQHTEAVFERLNTNLTKMERVLEMKHQIMELVAAAKQKFITRFNREPEDDEDLPKDICDPIEQAMKEMEQLQNDINENIP